ncbi:MAG TPA: SAM-dependent methyltransferase, partial [Sphingorhabdus sp.]|nr:SAM-dependent methyltransferase [Sphingorhabdus sp.]
MTLLTRLLSGRIHHGALTIVGQDGEQSIFGTPLAGWPSATLRLHSATAVRRILLNPRLGMGEAYMDGTV